MAYSPAHDAGQPLCLVTLRPALPSPDWSGPRPAGHLGRLPADSLRAKGRRGLAHYRGLSPDDCGPVPAAAGARAASPRNAGADAQAMAAHFPVRRLPGSALRIVDQLAGL